MKNMFVGGVIAFALPVWGGEFSFTEVRDLGGDVDHIEAQAFFDQQAASCLVDTGARFTLAKQSLIPGNKKVGEIRGGGVAGHEDVTDLVESQVRVGSWFHPGTPIARKADGFVPASCLLGNDFFLHRKFEINFEEKIVRDIEGMPQDSFPLNTYPSESGGHFGFELRFGEESVPSLFDTGATQTVVDLAWIRAHPQDFSFSRRVEATEGSNRTMEVEVYRARKLGFGPLNDENVEVYGVDLSYLRSKIAGVAAIVGLNQMRGRAWRFDPEQKTWTVQVLPRKKVILNSPAVSSIRESN